MKRGGPYWHTTLLNRFADREDIGKDKLYEQYFIDLPKADVFEFFDLIEFEYQIPAGLLRPEDNLSKLFEPIRTRNPFRWLEYQVREGDSQVEIINQLAKRQKQHGTYGTWSKIETIHEFVRSWCGQKPEKT